MFGPLSTPCRALVAKSGGPMGSGRWFWEAPKCGLIGPFWNFENDRIDVNIYTKFDTEKIPKIDSKIIRTWSPKDSDFSKTILLTR